MSATPTNYSASHWGLTTVQLDQSGLVQLIPNPDNPNPSALNDAMAEAIHSKLRVAHPALRKGWLDGSDTPRGQDEYVDIPWDEAFDLVEERLRATLQSHGNTGIFAGSYGWGSAGRFHNSQTQLKRFLNTIGGFVDQKQTYSFAAGQIICPHVTGDNRILFGSDATQWPAIIENAKVIVFFGGINLTNTQIAAGGLSRHETIEWLRRADDAGVKLISISPRRDRLEGFSNIDWLPIRPGTDVALMLGLMYELLISKSVDHAFLKRYTVGAEHIIDYIDGKPDDVQKTAEWASEICDLNIGKIKELAALLASKPNMITASWSIQRHEHGEQPLWMAIALSSFLGEIGKPGRGVCFGYGSIGNRGVPRREFNSPKFTTGTNPTGQYIPVSRFAAMLHKPGQEIPFNGETLTYQDIDLVWWAGGNPFHHHQHINYLVSALQKPSTIIVNEIWWTPMARHADIVLPAACSFERNDISASPTCDHVVASKAQLPPFGESKVEYDIYWELARRFGTEAEFTEGRTEMQWLQNIYEDFCQQDVIAEDSQPSFDEFWSRGHLQLRETDDQARTLFADFRMDPTAHPLKTPSGKIELYSERIASFGLTDFAAFPKWMEPSIWNGLAADDALHLLSPQPKYRLHSQLNGFGQSAACKIEGREPLFMSRWDADARGLSDRDLVVVFSEHGKCLAGLRIVDDLRQGVAMIETGAWYNPDQQGVDQNGSVNVLTSDTITSELSQGPAQNTTLVRVRKAEKADLAADRKGSNS